MYFDVPRMLFGIVGFIMVTSQGFGEQDELTNQSNESSSRRPFVPSPFTPFIQVGIAGIDFPNYTQVPYGIRFSCQNRYPGFYAEPVADCQVYHQCLEDGRDYSFLCGIGSIFNQRAFTCDHWYNYNCADAIEDYKYNAYLYSETFPEENDVTFDINAQSSSQALPNGPIKI